MSRTGHDSCSAFYMDVYIEPDEAQSIARQTDPSSRRALRAVAIGACAVGAFAVGALAIGALAIGRLKVGKARFAELEVDHLRVGKLSVPPPADQL